MSLMTPVATSMAGNCLMVSLKISSGVVVFTNGYIQSWISVTGMAAFLYCNSTTVHSTFRYDSPRFLYKERGRMTDKRSHCWADVSDMNLNLATDSKPWTPATKGFTQYTTMAEQLLYSDPPVKDFTAEKVRVHRCTEDDIRFGCARSLAAARVIVSSNTLIFCKVSQPKFN